jgi:hypothetical protein
MGLLQVFLFLFLHCIVITHKDRLDISHDYQELIRYGAVDFEAFFNYFYFQDIQ